MRFKTIGLVLLALFLLPVAVRAAVHTFLEKHPRSWRDADWSSAGLLPPAAADPEARVLVFAGHTGGWRGIVAVHTWIVVKPERARRYTRYDVTGFGGPLHVNRWPPDGRWFGDHPEIVADIRGPMAAAAIPKIEAAVAAYDYAKPGDYRIWPGPNSNTFVANVLRSVPELAIAMPAQAIGKDFRADGALIGLTASGTGIEASLWGMLGAKLGWVEGLELNFLGLVAGLDWRQPALKLPGFGRIAVVPVDTAQATGRSLR
jgi:hypothetical protein